MYYKLGRFLQFLGLFVVLPLALAGSMMEKIEVKDMFILSAVGVGVFSLGWLLQESGKPR